MRVTHVDFRPFIILAALVGLITPASAQRDAAFADFEQMSLEKDAIERLKPRTEVKVEGLEHQIEVLRGRLDRLENHR